MPEMSEYWRTLAAALRAGVDGFPKSPPEDSMFLPSDPADNRPELDALVPLVREGCRGVVDLDDRDWRVVCDELTYQMA